MSSESVVNCSICQDVRDDDSVENPDVTTTPCGHMFCTSCLDTWLTNNFTCPNCRCNIHGTGNVHVENDYDEFYDESYMDGGANSVDDIIIEDAIEYDIEAELEPLNRSNSDNVLMLMLFYEENYKYHYGDVRYREDAHDLRIKLNNWNVSDSELSEEFNKRGFNLEDVIQFFVRENDTYRDLTDVTVDIFYELKTSMMQAIDNIVSHYIGIISINETYNNFALLLETVRQEIEQDEFSKEDKRGA
jgi:hypothetical protein